MPLSDSTSLQEPLEPASFIESIRKFEERVGSITEIHPPTADIRQEEDQALESHEVVELQAFIERKEWINEKIIFLEALPKVEVFPTVYGTDLSEISVTRAQLHEWFIEQEKIEKETEMFDSGDLKKLKKLTKAATQRNLSPQDTDLIEVTLSTLYALDKLFNLLRNRSELLELLSLRLTWEELRLRALTDHTEIMADSRAFLMNCARWSPTIYSSSTSTSSGGKAESLTRSARFSLADSLSKSVTQISSRISTLRHGHVSMSAKTLDRFIEESPDSIPEWILDEQDKLEELCGNEITAVARFLLDVVTQWKRADEMYAETIKDRAALEELMADLHHATTEQPSRKKYNAMKTRLETLVRRIASRSDPRASDFPKPIHPAFPDQDKHNGALVDSLTSVLGDTKKSAQKANDQLKQYLADCSTMEASEALRSLFSQTRSELSALSSKLRNGIVSPDGDGSAPNLGDSNAVESSSFSLYLALFPSMLDEALRIRESAKLLVQDGRKLTTDLANSGIHSKFRDPFFNDLISLEASIIELTRNEADASLIVRLLRTVRQIWANMGKLDSEIGSLLSSLREEIIKHRWMRQNGEDSPPLTPVSATEEGRHRNIDDQVSFIKKTYHENILELMEDVKASLPDAMWSLLRTKCNTLQSSILEAESWRAFLTAVQSQASTMSLVREECHLLDKQVETVRACYDEYYHSIRSGTYIPSSVAMSEKEADLSKMADEIEGRVNKFLDNLHTRIPFITSTTFGSLMPWPETRSSRHPLPDASVIDSAVRNDSNACAIRLSGALKILRTTRSRFNFYSLYNQSELHLKDAFSSLASSNAIFSATDKAPERSTGDISDKMFDMECRHADMAFIEKALSSAGDSISCMRSFLSSDSDSQIEALVVSQHNKLNEAKSRFDLAMQSREAYSVHESVVDDASLQLAPDSLESLEEACPIYVEDAVRSSTQGIQSSSTLSYADRIQLLRKRVEKLGLNDLIVHVSHSSASVFPSQALADNLTTELAMIESEMEELVSSEDKDQENLAILNAELETSRGQLSHIQQLTRFYTSVSLCDTAFSDFLNRIDSHEDLMKTSLNPEASSDYDGIPEQIAETKGIFEDVMLCFRPVSDNPRALRETNRLNQTWEELLEMALEKRTDISQRPNSASAFSSDQEGLKEGKRNKYGSLSNCSPDACLNPSIKQRRAASSASSQIGSSRQGKSVTDRSRLSVSKQHIVRSVSGPTSPPMPARSLFNSTFSSRQRTTSVSSAFSTRLTTGKPETSPMPPRRMSSALSENRRINSALARSGHKGTWSRAPRQSINSIIGTTTPDINQRSIPKKYVANPDNKLDVALGDVINSLSVNINVEAVVDTWKDKSGKYWIGGDEPKLCFCRILRSQTVMVRVGGGWQELSTFIKNHFADLFRIIPESPERSDAKGQRWLSASSLRRGSEASFTMIPPGTPESLPPSLPSFALSTPEGTRTSTVHTPSPNASPLTPLQFIRRAGMDQIELSQTPSMNKSKSNATPQPLRTRRSTTNSQSKVIWRP